MGVFAVKFAVRSKIYPIIAIAGKGKDFVAGLIYPSRGDVVLNYRDGNEKLASGIEEAVKRTGAGEAHHTFDAICEKGSPEMLSDVLPSGAHLTFVLPNLDYSHIPKRIITSVIDVGFVHTNVPDDNDTASFVNSGNGHYFDCMYSRLFGQGLKEEWPRPHPVEIMTGGLTGVADGLNKSARRQRERGQISF